MNIKIREITAIPTLMYWRKEVIENVSGEVPSKRLLVEIRRYYRTHIADGTHIAIVAEADGTDVGCGAICLFDGLPSSGNPSGRCACLVNIYVRREYRRRGIGRTIIKWLVAKARQSGYDRIRFESTDKACGSSGKVDL